jgi:hypothetical protein
MARLARFACAALVLAALGAPRVAAAAQDTDNCTGMIGSLPTTISTPGTWCMDQGFGVLLSAGVAITINSDNVVLDCNGNVVDNDTAAASTTASGVASTDRRNVTVRRCRFDGFFRGVYLQGLNGGGNVVEDNRFENSRNTAIQLEGDDSVARRNRIFNTGGSTADPAATGIGTNGAVDVLDNTIVGVSPGTNGNGYGIVSSDAPDATIAGNRVRGVTHGVSTVAVGIWALAHGRLAMRGNDLVGDASSGSFGLLCDSAQARSRDNVISGWATSMQGCGSGGGNVVRP